MLSKEKGTYKTLLKTDPDYYSYLLGTFSKEEVAVPMESFGVGSERERTTFLVLPTSGFQRPNWLKVYFSAIRPELLGLTLGHSLLAILSLKFLLEKHNFSTAVFSQEGLLVIVLCLLAAFFTHASACLFNDYQDHLNGTDLKSIRYGSRVIQKAWSRAYEVRRWAFVNACLAFAVGIYLLHGHWMVLAGLTAISGMAILFYSEMTPFWNRWGAGDFWITLLFGPLMFFAVWASILSPYNLLQFSSDFFVDGLILALCFGLLASWTLQMRQFQDIFKRKEGSFRTLISRMSFDQAKTFLKAEGAFFFTLQPLVFFSIWRNPVVSLPLVFGVLFSLFALWGVRKVPSPLSSQMLFLNKKALLIHGSFLFLWAGSLWLL